jgi:hypothetical protein
MVGRDQTYWSGDQLCHQERSNHERESSGVERSDKTNARQYRCEAGLRAEPRASGAEMALANSRLHSGVERSDEMNAQQYRCEAGLRAEQHASGAEMALANSRLHSGVERSDKIKRPGSGVDRVFEAVHN